MVSILQSSTTCWTIMIRDYGVVGTVSASASITLVLLLAIAMHKAFLSNSATDSNHATSPSGSKSRGTTAAEKKRRRRKGTSNKNSNRGRIKAGGSSTPTLRLPKVEEVDGAGSDSSTRSSSGDASDYSAIQLKDVFDEPKQSTEEEANSIMTSPSALESVVSVEEFEVKARTPVPSVCTVDTTSMSDDISCGSFSVRSGVLPSRPMRSVNTPTSAKGKPKSNTSSRGKAKAIQHGQKQTNLASPIPVPVPNSTRAEGLKNAKPVPKHSMSPDCFPSATSEPKMGRGRKVGARSKGGRPLTPKHHPKHLLAARTVSPVTTTCDNTLLVSSTPSTNPTILSGSPASANMEHNNNRSTSRLMTSNENNHESRLPPFSPYSQSLFSCELGASQWSLPTLPVVSQPKNVASVMSATGIASSLVPSSTSNPFVMPCSQMPSECNGHTSSYYYSSLGLWNTLPVQADNNHSLSLGTLSTPPPPVRPPPGLTAPPGFASNQPMLAHKNNSNNGAYTPGRTAGNETPSLMPAKPSFGAPSTVLEVSPVAWNGTSSAPSAFMMTMNQNSPVVAKNPFAGDSNEVDWRIEAELQELGGRMIGSVLDGL
jgi:hypothetical protein